MKKIIYLCAVLICVCLWSCNSEDTLKADDPLTFYDFPQGTASYDKEFEQFYKDYGTQILYKFNESDFRWDVTSYLPFYADNADTANVAQAWSFIKTNCFSIWPDSFLKKYLPYRILLANDIYSWSISYTYDSSGNSVKDSTKVYKDAMYGLNHITFGMANSQLATLTADQKKELIGEMAFALIGYATSSGKMTIPDAFTTYYSDYISHNGSSLASGWGGWGYNGAGCLEYYEDMDCYYDFALYVKYSVMYSPDEFAAKFLNDSFDCGSDTYNSTTGTYVLDHRVKNKYNVVINYFKNTLGIDLGAIGTTVSAIQ